MTRECAEKGCKFPHMGEKCPECGSQNLILLNQEHGEPPPDWFECHNHHFFKEGEGGVTHGICDPCFQKLDLEAYESDLERRSGCGTP